MEATVRVARTEAQDCIVKVERGHHYMRKLYETLYQDI